MTITGSSKDFFKSFLDAEDFRPTIEQFRALVQHLCVTPAVTSGDNDAFYNDLHTHLRGEASNLWKSLDRRRVGKEYGGGTICKGVNVSMTSYDMYTVIIYMSVF